MSDYIRRADVIRLLVERYKFTTSEATDILSAAPSAEAVSMEEHCKELNDLAVAWNAKFVKAEKRTNEIYDETMTKVAKECKECKERLRNLRPSAEAEGEDLVIKGAKGIQDGLYNIKDGKLFKYKANGGTVRTYPIVPSAEVKPMVIRTKTIMSEEDYDRFAEDIKRQGENIICIPCDAEVVYSEAVQGEWEDMEIQCNPYPPIFCVECSACGYRVGRETFLENTFNFCPNCGAMMKGEEE